MANRQQIERDCMLDAKAVLDAAGISNVIIEDAVRPSVASFACVKCVNLRGNLQGGNLPSGMYQADMEIEANSYYDDDTNGATLSTLIGAICKAIFIDDILTDLNTASTYHKYYGMLEGDSVADQDGRYRIRAIQFSLIVKPEK